MEVSKISVKEYTKLREALIHKLKNKQTEKRFEHTLRVEKVAIEMANIYGANVQAVSIAALLHDYAKKYDNEKKAKLVKKYELQLNEAENLNIDLVHGRLAAEIGKDKFHISDIDIINAVSYHTTGRPNMSMIEKIIYIADFVEPGRDLFSGMAKARELARENLDEALLKILLLTLNHVIDQGGIIDPRTEKAYEFYYSIHNNNIRKKEL